MILNNNLLLVVDFLDQYKADKGWDQTNCRSIAKSGLIAYGSVCNENTPIRRGVHSFFASYSLYGGSKFVAVYNQPA